MKHKLHIKGKKSGIVGSAISNFWSYVLFVFVVIIFFVIFSIQEREVRENVIGSSESETNIDIVALNYLRTPTGNGRNFAGFISELMVPVYLGPTDPTKLQKTIDDQAAKANIEGYKRFMIFLDNGACIYDSRNQGCQGRQWSYFQIPEGSVLLAVPIKPNDIKFVEAVFQ